LFGILYAVYSIAVKRYVFSIAPGQFSSQLTELERTAGFRFKTLKRSSYLNFSRKKLKGVIRIGCFGDSLVHGAEVSSEYDYPTFLQKIIKDNGIANVEVLNFGNFGDGFHQSYMVWETLGQYYDLDYILVGPGTFWPERELTFNSSLTYEKPYDSVLCHSRYVLVDKGDKATRMDVPNSTMAEMARDYLGFFSSLKYLPYDINFPSFLRLPFNYFFHNRDLKNIFYYYSDHDQEALKIYHLLLARMASGGSKVYVLFYPDWQSTISYNFKDGIFGEKVKLIPIADFIFFPYRAPFSHNSPMGNSFLAHSVFNVLFSGHKTSFMRLTPADGEHSLYSDNLLKSPLYHYSQVGWEIGGVLCGGFFDLTSGDWRKYCFGDSCNSYGAWSLPCVSLVGLVDKGKPITEAFFLVLPFEVSDRKNVEISIGRAKAKSRYIRSFPLRLPHQGLNIGVVDVAMVASYHYNQVVLSKDFLGKEMKVGDVIEIKIDGKCILKGIIEKCGKGLIRLSVIDGKWLVARAFGDKMLNIDNMAKSGDVYLFLKDDLGEYRIPLARYEKIGQ
jgi:hypothetical protein